jgi:hypothetical protein
MCDISNPWSFAIPIAYMCLEAWLGRTQKVKAGSVIDLALGGILFVIKLFLKKPTKGE